ncbi:MAG: preprotein translocase subunit SecA, partial [Candidatus Komeilibacteria bacterium CG_4_9_14_3_um_filter_37_5]
IENGMISKSIESAQRKVEGHNFDIRKHLVEYDDVINKHREVIYQRRKNILLMAEGRTDNLNWLNIDGQPIKSLSDYIADLINQELDQVINFHTTAEGQQDYQEILETLKSICQLADSEIAEYHKIINDHELESHQIRHQLIEHSRQLLQAKYTDLQAKFAATVGDATAWSRVELSLILRTIDNLWIDHLEAIDYLKQGIGLRGYGQRDPLVEYKKESFLLFDQLLDSIQNEIVYNIFKLGETINIGGKDLANRPLNLIKNNPTSQFAQQETERQSAVTKTFNNEPKVGRNEPCPCGSGKKYKKCHGV